MNTIRITGTTYNHLHDFRGISMKKALMLSGKTQICSKTALILLRTHNNNPPPYILRFNLNGILNPWI